MTHHVTYCWYVDYTILWWCIYLAVDKNYRLHVDKKLKVGSHVRHKSGHQQHRGKSQSSQKSKKGETPPTFLDDDLDFMDTILMGLDSIDADPNRLDWIR